MNTAKAVRDIKFNEMDESLEWEYVMLDTLVFKNTN